MKELSSSPNAPTTTTAPVEVAPLLREQPTEKEFERQALEDWESEGGFVPPIDDDA